jgi:ribosomal-protein-alanine N-acetyltransferase
MIPAHYLPGTCITMSQSLPNTLIQENQYPLRIRPMQLADLEYVHAIDVLSFTMPWPASAFHYELVENPNSQLWVAEVDTGENKPQIIGAIVTWLILDEAHIATLAVHPEHRERGVGSWLVAVALEAAIHAGALSATLEVREGNQVARRLYRRFNFKIVGRRLNYYQDNHEDALLMTLHSLDNIYLQWLENGDWQQHHFVAQQSSSGNVQSIG